MNQVLNRINAAPGCLADIGWREATDNFRSRRIEEIIVGITDDEVSTKAGEFIVLEWYETCENERLSRYIPLGAHEWYGRLQKMGIAGMYDEHVDFVSEQVEGWRLRYCHIEKENDNNGNYAYWKSIERVIDEAKRTRSRINSRKKQKQELAEKVKQLHGVQFLDKGEEEEEQIKRLRQELCESREVIKDCNEEICRLKEVIKQLKGKVKAEGNVSAFIHHLVEYAEGEQVNVAREVRIAIDKVLMSAYQDPEESPVLTKALQTRLDTLGKEQKNTSVNISKPVGTFVAHADSITINPQNKQI